MNNAGIVNEVCAKRTIGINIVALIEWSMSLYTHMRKDKGGTGGTIVNVASMNGILLDPFLPYLYIYILPIVRRYWFHQGFRT